MCDARYDVKIGHQCYSFLCEFCGEWYKKDKFHNCVLPPKTSSNEEHISKILFFDIECFLEPRVDEDGSEHTEHVPNCIVFHLWYENQDEREADGMPEWYVASSIGSAVEFLFQSRSGQPGRFFSAANGWRVISHNGHGYDENFFLREVLKSGTHRQIYGISNGMGFKDLKIYDVHFLDSFQFLSTGLAKLARDFGIPIRKGAFPYLFNRSENEYYWGELPDVKYFKGHEQWHREHGPFSYDQERDFGHLSFDDHATEKMRQGFSLMRCSTNPDGYWLWGETVLYCVNDVKILRDVWLKFRQITLDAVGVDPTAYLTTSQVALAAFQILMDPNKPFSQRIHRFSEKHAEFHWRKKVLYFIGEKEKKDSAYYRLNIPSFRDHPFHGVDWANKKLFYLLRCKEHACSRCYKASMHKGTDMNYLRRESNKWRAVAERAMSDFTIEWTFECEFDRLHENLSKLHELVNAEDIPLDPREAMRGGRTECFVPYTPIQKGCYFDVCSLYPTVMNGFPMPTSIKAHYKNPSISSVMSRGKQLEFGLYRCRVLPPRKLRIPVLPCKFNEKLMFALCRTCAQECDHTKTCDHGNAARSLVSTWTSVELNRALKRGYVLEKVYECVVFHSSTTIFKRYVETFLKMKTSADGDKVVKQWLRTKKGVQREIGDETWVISDEERKSFVEEYNKRYEVHMTVDELKKNSSLRAVAKLMLNSLWGKFCARIHGTRTKWVFGDSELLDVLTNNRGNYIKNLEFYSFDENQYFGLCHSERLDCRQKDHFFGNVVLGCFVTAHARDVLYQMMQRYEDYVLYCDTDSVFLNLPPDVKPPEAGVFLSEWTDELDGLEMVGSFVSLGPKSYAYRVQSERDGENQVVKMKGVPKSAQVCGEEVVRSLMYSDMERILLRTVKGDSHDVSVRYTLFKKTHTRDVTTRDMVKRVRLRDDKEMILFNKRKLVVFEDQEGRVTKIDSLPWGYCSHN